MPKTFSDRLVELFKPEEESDPNRERLMDVYAIREASSVEADLQEIIFRRLTQALSALPVPESSSPDPSSDDEED